MIMTATEVAKYDILKNNDLVKVMGTLTHQNLPRSMYLISSTLGFKPPEKPFPRRSTNKQIIDSLGLGTVHFRDLSPGDGSGAIPNPTEYTYHTNTEVITSIKVYTGEKQELSPKNQGYVNFNILGRTYTKNSISPRNDEELVYVRWKTPSTPQDVIINISSNANPSSSQITAKIIDLKENTPPDPQVTDKSPNFQVPLKPRGENDTQKNWSQWRAFWQSNWVWVPKKGDKDGGGDWVDKGFWNFSKEHFEAKLGLDAELRPADSCETAIKKNGRWDMKSAYGVEMEVKPLISNNGQQYDVTSAGNAMTFFPEFKYKTYNRMMEKDNKGMFVYKHNEYSFVGENCHYTPIWYPDNSKYEVMARVFDIWTPAGQMYIYETDFVTINGNVYDDIDVAHGYPDGRDY